MATRAQTIFLFIAFLLLALIPLTGSRHLIELAVQVLIYGLLAMSLNVLSGHVGSISFGHAAFFAIGGYACAYFQTTIGLPLPISMIAAVLLTAVASLVIGYFCVRLNEMHFAMLTLAFSMLVWAVAFKWKPVTGGGDGFVGVTIPQFIATPTSFFWFTFLVVALSIAALWVLSNSTMGRVFIAIRENPTRASFVGINVRLMRLIAFTIAGSFAAIAGCLLALYIRGMFPESAFWSQSGQVMIMVLLGGIRSFVGPLLGATTLYLLEVTTSQHTEYWQFFLGLILMGIVLIAPEGLFGIFKSLHARVIARFGRNA